MSLFKNSLFTNGSEYKDYTVLVILSNVSWVSSILLKTPLSLQKKCKFTLLQVRFECVVFGQISRSKKQTRIKALFCCGFVFVCLSLSVIRFSDPVNILKHSMKVTAPGK